MCRTRSPWGSCQSASATAAAARSAGKTMLTCLNWLIFQKLGRDIPKKQWLPVSQLHGEHLVEIAVVHLSHPAYTESRATHQSLDGNRIEAVSKQGHVLVPFIQTAKVLCESCDWLVSDCEHLVE